MRDSASKVLNSGVSERNNWLSESSTVSRLAPKTAPTTIKASPSSAARGSREHHKRQTFEPESDVEPFARPLLTEWTILVAAAGLGPRFEQTHLRTPCLATL